MWYRFKKWFKLTFHRCEGNCILERNGNMVIGNMFHSFKTSGVAKVYQCDTCKKKWAVFHTLNDSYPINVDYVLSQLN